jgi:hypothetical protein
MAAGNHGDGRSRAITMSETVWVRELSAEEQSETAAAKTGDILSDGSILLWRDDMHRMGLQGLRTWIIDKVMKHHTTIAVGTDNMTFRPLDEMS